MSKVKKIVESRLSELAFIEMQKEDGELVVDQTLTTISFRVSKDLVNQIDIIANKLELSRSDIVRSFLSASVSEAFQVLGMSLDEIFELMAMLDTSENKEEKYKQMIAGLEEKQNG